MRAVALSTNLDTGETLCQPFADSADPILDCWAFLRSVERDYPAPLWVAHVVADDEAKVAAVKRLRKQYGLTEDMDGTESPSV